MKNYILRPILAFTSAIRSAKSSTIGAIAFVAFSLLFGSTAFSQTRITGLTISPTQTGAALTYGTGASVTYTVTITTSGGGNGNEGFTFNWIGTTPTGVTLAPANLNPRNITTFTLTVTTSNTTAAGTYNFTITSTHPGGSATSPVSSSLFIGAKALTISGAITKVYGTTLTGGAGSTAFTPTGLANGETIGSVTSVFSAGATAASGVGTYSNASTPSLAAGGTFNANNYIITYNSGNIVVTGAPLTITANNQTKTYGSAFTFAGTEFAAGAGQLKNSDNVTGVTLASAGAATTATVGGGPYTIVPSAAAGTGLANYTISYVNGTMTVNKLALTVSGLTANNKIYDANTNVTGFTGGTLAGIANGDNVTLARSGTFASKIVANSIIVTSTSTLGGTGAGNYILIQPTGLSANITGAPLTLTATGPTKTYGTALTAGPNGANFTATGEVGSENTTSVTLTPNAAGLSASTPAGAAYAVVPSAPTGTGGFLASNYVITVNNYNGIVAKAALNINANNVTHTYGTAITSPGAGITTGYTSTGLQNSETIGSVTINYNAGTAANSPARTYNGAVVISAATGGTFNPSNYTFTYNAGDIIVNPANLTITAITTKVYGANSNVFLGYLGASNFTVTGLVNSETITQVNFINTGTGAPANANVGSTYTAFPQDFFGLLPPTGAGFNANNYNITYVQKTVTVVAAPLSITATGPITKVYGTTLSAVSSTTSFTTTGAVLGQAVTSVTLTPSGPGITATAPVGTAYTETPSAPIVGSGGFLASNYAITYVPFTTGVVTTAPLTITATSFTKPYGTVLTSGPAATGFTSTGLVAGESISNVNLSYAAAVTPANAAIGTTGLATPGPAVTGTGTFNSSNYFITYNVGTITVGAAIFDWIGGVSTDWTTPGNWSVNGAVQTANYPGLNEATDVIQIGVIPYANTANQPTFTAAAPFSTNNIIVGNSEPVTLTINANLALTITGVTTFNTGSNFTLTEGIGASLNLNGNFSNAGTLNFGTNLVNFNGTTAQSITSSTPVAFANVSFSGGGTKTVIAGAFSVTSTGVLTISNNTSLNGGGFFSLSSDVNGAASVAPVPPGCTITNVNVERYMPGGFRGYRLMSSPVNAGVKDGSGNTIYSINYLANTTYISGTNFTPSATVKKGNPSLYLLRENLAPTFNSFLTSNYRGIADISASPNYTINLDPGTFNIPVGNGYLFFFRGGLTTINPFVPGSTPAPGTLIATGTLNSGQIVMHDWYTPSSPNLGVTALSNDTNIEGFNLVGNPYACTIDLATTNTSNPNTGIYAPGTSPFVYELNPQIGNYGLYTTDGSLPITNNASRYIASGQGYLVQALVPSAQYIFNESAKSVGTQITGPALLMGKPADLTTNIQYLRLKMAMDTVNSDETIISFDKNTKPQYDVKEDALYKTGSGKVGLSSVSVDSKRLAVNRMPLNQKAVTVPLSVSAVANGTYSLSMNSLKGVPELYDIWLMDTYRKDSLDMRHNSTYRFDVIKTDTASLGAYRFKLVLRQNPALAYHLLNFAANKGTGKQVQLNWVTENEANYTNFTVERSIDGGKTYDVVGGIPSSGAGIYTLLDKYPGSNNLYRLKQEDINDSITYSHIIPVSFSNLSNNLASNNINVYPNPATSDVHLVVNSAIENTSVAYNFTITNSYGLLIKQGTSTQSNWQTNISDLLPGTYIIQVINDKDQSLIGKTKLVKL